MANLDYDYDYDDSPRTRPNSNAMVWNILTVVLALGVVCVAGGFLAVFINPNSALNPFPPPTMPAALTFPTVTPTPLGLLPPTWTPIPTQEPTATETPLPTGTPFPTETPNFPITASPEAPTATARTGGMPFVVKGGKSMLIANIAHPDAGCNWMGVAGRAFDLKGAVLFGLQVQLGGYLTGSSLSQDFNITLTGLAQAYGPGYYEFTLADHPIASKGTLWIQLLDQAGLPLSDKVYFDTSAECDQNLILIDFEQVR